MMSNIMLITIGSTILTATLHDNPSVTALKGILNKGPLTINMNDYANMEKVGPIGTTIPRTDVQMNTQPGDIIVYQGDKLVIYYSTNSWSLTPIGKINKITQPELKQILGEGSVTVTFSLPESTEETTSSIESESEDPLNSMPNTESSDQSESSLVHDNPEANTDKKNSKTAIIAGTVCAVVVVVVIVALTLTCYFKKYLCFDVKAGRSTSEFL